MFDRASNVQLGGDPLEINYPNFTVMSVFQQNISIFFNVVLKSTNSEPGYLSSQVNIQYVCIYHIPQSPFYFQIEIL